MPRKTFSDEQIAPVLRQAEAGVPVQELIRKAGITEPGAHWAHFIVGSASLLAWAWWSCDA